MFQLYVYLLLSILRIPFPITEGLLTERKTTIKFGSKINIKLRTERNDLLIIMVLEGLTYLC